MFNNFEMKDSGAEWIGMIPKHWEKKKLSYLIDFIGSGTTPKAGVEKYYENGSIPWLITADLNDNYVLEAEKYISNVAMEDYPILKQFPLDSISIAMYGSIGKLGHLKINAAVNQANCLMIFSQDNQPRYWFYVLLAIRKHLISLAVGGVQLNINQDIIKSLRLYRPPLEEQNLIAKFLDKKTERIDHLIKITQKKIELLKEQRTSLIKQCVTKGLNPNVEMKQSGIEAIGKIPKEWIVKKIKYVCSSNSDNLSENTSGNYKFHYIEINDVDYINGILFKEKIQFKESPSRARRIAKPGDIIVSTVRTYLKAIGTVPNLENVVCSTGFCVLRSKDLSLSQKFLSYIVKSESFIHSVIKESYGVSYPAITSSDLISIKVPLPPLSEQKRISDYLDKIISKIDQMVDIETKRINLLKEYRKSLISSLVTGKSKVTEDMI